MKEKKFDKTKYDINYHKEHKIKFVVNLNKFEMNSVNELLKVTNTKKSDFLRKAIRREWMENNILYFDRLANCDFCGKKDYVAITRYESLQTNKLICNDCANDIIKKLNGNIPNWYKLDDNKK